MERWIALLAFVGVASLAKLWTSEERRDTQTAFAWQSGGHNGWVVLKGHADDPHEGPALEHCSFDWTGSGLLRMHAEHVDPEREETWGEWIDDCSGARGVYPILAAPELAIGNIVPSLVSARADGHSRFGVASLRPIATTRATTGEFLRLHGCVVEFAVADDGIPLERFKTWGELAEAADAAQGTLVVGLPHDLEALPRSPGPAWVPDEDSVTAWAPFHAFPDR
jgi:hypothetical protein